MCPVIVEQDTLLLQAARHPLIASEEVVPVDITCGGEIRALIITGPNTGGKTVTLKTAGLFVMLAQTGMFVPCAKAELPIFNAVFADIGDEQSIEQSLSTFSSHMVNLVEILRKTGQHCLVLVDELGAGTDPAKKEVGKANEQLKLLNGELQLLNVRLWILTPVCNLQIKVWQK